MKCSKCGAELESNALICSFCGHVVSQEGPDPDKPMSKKEFLNLPAMSSCRGNIISGGGAFCCFGVLNMVFQIINGHFLPVDGIIMILLGLGICLGKSRVCSILGVVYCSLNLIYLIITTGNALNVISWCVLFDTIYAAIYTIKFHSAWNRYQKDGILPVEKEKK